MGGAQMMGAVRRALGDMRSFSRVVVGLPLRDYQLAPLRAVLAAVLARAGGSYVVEFSRQSGKDEAVAQLLAFLLLYYKNAGGKVVLAAPSAGQSAISKQRLRQRLQNPFSGGLWRTEGMYSLQVGKASAAFLTANASANVRGHTASLLLIGNEAQDIDPDVWDSRFMPMTASTNAPTLYLGTPWRSDSLLARQLRQAEQEQARDGTPHVFKVDWQGVAEELPAYRQHVMQRAAQLGWQHPFIKTEYQLIELDGGGGMFDAHRRGQMRGAHERQHYPSPQPSPARGEGEMLPSPQPSPARGEGEMLPSPQLSPARGEGELHPSPQPSPARGEGATPPSRSERVYAMLLDVAGEAEAEEAEIRAANPRKDSTALTVVEVDSSGERLVYLVRDRRELLGVKHTALYEQLLDLANNVWPAATVVVDATGVGAGLASFLQARLGRRLIPFVFSVASKSKLGWDFLALVESGRYKDYAADGRPDTARFWQQVEACQFEVMSGPGKMMRWGVPEPTVHDDLLISAALTATLDSLDLKPRTARARGYL